MRKGVTAENAENTRTVRAKPIHPAILRTGSGYCDFASVSFFFASERT